MNMLVFIGILVFVFSVGFLMDRGRKFSPWFFVEYGALALPLVIGYGTGGGHGLLETGVAYLMALVALYLVAKLDWHATFVPTGEIKFIIAGERAINVLAHVPGYHIEKNEARWLLVADTEDYSPEYEPFFTRWFGIHWVSLFFPLMRVLHFKFEWFELFEGTKPPEKEGATTTQIPGTGIFYIQRRKEVVPSMRVLNPYPVWVQGAELAGNLKIDVLVSIVVRAVDPVLATLLIKGWLDQVVARVSGAIADTANGMSLDNFRDMDKDTGSELIDNITKKINGELREKFGIEITTALFHKYDQIGTEKEKEAASALAVATLEAEADLERGRGEGGRERNRLEGRAAGLEAIGNAVGNDIAARAQIIGAQVNAEAIAEFTGDVLSLGGAGTPVMVSAQGREDDVERKKKKKKR